MKIFTHFILISLLFLLPLNSFAQYHWEWGRSMHSPTDTVTTNSDGWSISTDHFGHVYAGTTTGGYMATSALFDTFLYVPPSPSGYYCPVIKYDTSGKVIWAKFYFCGLFGLSGLVTDSVGNVYIAGSFNVTAMSIGTQTLYNSAGTRNNFIAKLDSNGNTVWAKQIDSAGVYPSLTVDNSGHLFLTGSFVGSQLILGTDTLYNHHPGHDEILTVKMDTSGAVIWARNAGGRHTVYNPIFVKNSIAVDLAGNLIITGGMSDTIYFDTVTLTTNFNNAVGRVFIAEYSPSGGLLWAKDPGGLSHYTGYGSSSGWWQGDSGNSLTTDNLGNIYLAGSFSTYYMCFGLDTVFNYHEGLCDVFLAKITPLGTPIWLKHFGGIDNDVGGCVALDQTNQHVWLSGGLQSHTGYFGIDTVHQSDGPGYYNSSVDGGFVARLDTAGNPNLEFPLTFSGDDFSGIALDVVGNLYLTGDYETGYPGNDTVIIACDTLAYAYGKENFFIAKLAGPWVKMPDTIHTDTTSHTDNTNHVDTTNHIDITHNLITPVYNTTNKISIHPNPTNGMLVIDGALNCDLAIYDVLGRILTTNVVTNDKQVLDITTLPNGVLFLEFINHLNGTKIVKKILKE